MNIPSSNPLSRRSERTPRGRTPRADDPKRQVHFGEAWQEAKRLIVAHRRRLAIGIVLMLVSRVSGLVLPWSTRTFVDDILVKGQQELLKVGHVSGHTLGVFYRLLEVNIAATLVSALTGYALSQVLGVAAQRAITEMRRTVQAHVERLPVSYFDSTQTGVLISRIMNDAEGIRNLVGNGLVQLLGGLVTAVIALVWLLWLNWQLTTFTVVFLAAFGGGMSLAFPRLRPLFRERGKITAEVTGRLAESLGGIRIVKAYTAEPREQKVFTKGAHRLFRNVARSITGMSLIGTGSGIIVGAIGVIIMYKGGLAFFGKQMTLGQLLQYTTVTAMLAAPLVQLASIGTQISEAFAGLDRIREIQQMTTEDAGDATRDTLPVLRGDIEFQDVWFEYNPGQPVLKGVSFRAPAGSTTALVGSSGSGKSTMTGLVMAFHRPKQGRILVDGHDLSTLRLRDFRRHLGVVLQENFLFDGTISENIAFSRPSATPEEIREVARIAHCDEFIEKFPQKYDTVVGERGIKLSGGQRQRVAIARAILADPKVLILDEATSSLDSESEAMIQAGLKRLRYGRTSFVIAHRLSTIRSADQILVVEDGQVVERGTHAELMELNGRYRDLHDRQYAIELDRFINPGEDFTPDLPKVPGGRPADAAVTPGGV